MAVIGSLVAQLSLDAAAFVRDLNQAGDSLDKAGRRMAGVGRNISTFISAPLAGFGALALKTSAEFEAGMNKLESVSGATGAELSKLREEAKKLGAQIEFGKFSALDAAQGMTDLAQAGFKTNEIITAMPGLLQLATASQMELGQAAETVSSILRGYGLQVEDLGHVNDVLTKASIETNAELQSLGEALKFVGPVASTAGLSFEEIAAAIGKLSDAGIQGEMAGTALRGAITQILNPSADAAAAMADLGIQLTDSAGRIRPLVQILEELAPHADDAGLFMELFGQRAGPGMAALVQQGAGSLAELTATLENSGGTAAKVASTQLQGFGAAMEGLRSSFEGLQIAIGDSGLLQFATELVIGVTKIVETLSTLDPATLKFASILAGAVAAGGPLILLLGGAAVAIGALLSPIGLVVTAIVGTAGLIGAIYAFREAIAASFVRAIDTSIAKFVYLKEQVLEAIRALVVGVEEWLGTRLTAAFDAVAAPIQATIDAFRGMYEAVVGQSWVPDMILGIQEWFGKLPAVMSDPARREVEKTMREFEKLAAPTDMFSEAIKEQKATAARAADRASELAARPFENALTSIQGQFSSTFEEIFSGGVTTFEDLAESAKKIFVRLAAELATLAIFQPGALFGGAGAAGAPGALGGGLLGGGLLAGGLGFVGGSLAGGLFGPGGQMGGGIGGGLGAALGFGVGGPLGAVAGGLLGSIGGGLLGSIFGGGGSSGNEVSIGGGLGAGTGGTGAAAKFVVAFDKQMSELLNDRQLELADQALKEARAVSVKYDKELSEGDKARLAAGRVAPVAGALGFRKRAFEGLGAEEALGRLQEALQLERTIEDLTGSVTPFKRSLLDLRAEFESAIKDAREFGISTKGMGKALREAEAELRAQRNLERASLRLQLQAIIGSGDASRELAVAIATIRIQFQGLRENAEALGVPLKLVRQAEQAAIQQAREAAAQLREQRQFERAGLRLQLQAIIGSGNASRELAVAIAGIRLQFHGLRKDAEELGVSLKLVEQAEKAAVQQARDAAREAEREAKRQREADKAAAKAFLRDFTVGDDYQRQLNSINDAYLEAVALAREYNLSERGLRDAKRDSIRALKEQQRAEIDQLALSVVEPFLALSNPLRDFVDDLERSLLSPVELFRVAQEDFRETARRAQAGDIEAINRLDETGRFYLEQAGQFGASPAQVEATQEVLHATQGVTQQVDISMREATKGIRDEVRLADRHNVDTLNELKAEVREVAREIKKLRT